tara:strand:+ start:166 stop:699 length:534 start_codon:yes stop_codon:yes gene_type:complete
MSKEQVRTNPYGIKTPTTIDEFRENLMKYFVCISNGDINDTLLYVQEGEIDILKIESLSDVYKIREMGFHGTNENFNGGSSPHIIPRISIKKELTEYMEETHQSVSCHGYFYDENNFDLHECSLDNYKEDHTKFMKTNNGKWYTLDNQWSREFYWITLGKFSGYDYSRTLESDEEVV